jgi:hypothetical protein
VVVGKLRDEGVHDRVEDAVPSEKGKGGRGQDGVDRQDAVKVADGKGPRQQDKARDEVETQHEGMSIVVCQRHKRDGHEKV